ncbi:MAG: PorP/SprF family type IX secretion system membrane protein, partial [Bacteroidia bacterium]|nr:PorP/SprF family type IX secretion system membrane protein [Bacteroidia bacterium]
ENTQLRFGVSLGVVDHTYDYSKAIVENSNDPTLFNEVQRKTTFDGNAGLAFVFKGLQFGVAVPQVIGNNVNYIENSDVRSYYAMARHYMGSLGYKFVLSKEKEISLTPLGLVRYLPNAPLQYDGSLTLNWNNLFWIGGTYKSDYAVSANIGFRLHKQLFVGYSYDIIIGDVGKYAGVSHELMLNFKFGKNKKADEVVSPKKENLQNEAYVKRMDSIQNQLKQNQAKIEELTKKLEEQRKASESKPQVVQSPPVQQTPQPQVVQQVQTPPEVKNTVVTETPSNKTRENGVLLASNPKSDFRDTGNAIPNKGFYVVVGTYYYRDLAIAEAQRYKAKGYSTTDWVYSGPKGYNYIFMFKCQTKAEAIEKVKIAQQAGATDAWIQALTD